jgi:4-hydroxy-2-oxoglutarate aldolase
VAVEAPTVVRLAEHPNIAGIKESSGNIQRVAEIIHSTPAGFQTLVGSASTYYPAMAMGARGGILAVSCFLPELCVELYEAAVAADAMRARSIQQRLLAPSAIVVARHGVPGVKYAMDQLGYYGGPARRPFLALTEKQKQEIDAALAGVVSRAVTGN